MPANVPPRKTAPPPSAAEAGGGAMVFLALVTGNVALAFGAWFVRLADTGPVAAAFWRIALAAPLLALLAVAGGARPVRMGRARWGVLAVAGIAFAGDLGTWHLGILRTTLANATLLGNCATFLFPLYGFLVARAWPTRTQGMALLLAAAGAMLLMGRSYELNPANLVGDALCLLAGVLYAVYFIVMARVREDMAPLPALAVSTAASALPLLAFAVVMGDRLWPGDWTPIVGLVLVSQMLGQGCMIYALGRASPLMVGLTLLIQPVVAAAVGWIVYGERLGPVDAIGIAMVAAALVLVRRRPEVAPDPAGPHVGDTRSRA